MRNADCFAEPWQYDVQWRALRVLETISDSRQKTLCQHSDRDSEMETDAQLNEWGPAGHNGGVWGRRSGVPSLCQRFQLSPSTLVTIYEHDLPTLQLPYSARSPTSRTPQLHQTTPPSIPLTLWPAAPAVSRQDKPFDRACKTISVICMFLNASTCTHPRSQTGPLCSHWGVSSYSSAQAQRWLIKKSNTVNAQGHQHINI